jgi:hypothetical protein
MIHYHGGPITPVEAAAAIWSRRHAFVSYAAPEQVVVAAEVCQSFALDNGAFSAWKKGKKMIWAGYYTWVADWKRHPGCDFAVIPDIINGSEKDNDALLLEWPHGHFGVPVWHLHESFSRLERLANEHPRIALGSSGTFATPGNDVWRGHMQTAMKILTDSDGLPITKIHGLRMLNPAVFCDYPLASADSTNVARNIGIDKKWKGTYTPSSKAMRGNVLAERIEATNSAGCWHPHEVAVKRGWWQSFGCLLGGQERKSCGLCAEFCLGAEREVTK